MARTGVSCEQDKMEAAAAASVKDVACTKKTAALPRAATFIMCVVSLLFAVLTAWALLASAAGDEEAAYIPATRRLPPLICAYLTSWTVTLSDSESRVAALLKSVRAAFLPALGYLAAELISPVVGAAAMFVATLHFAAATGRALAEHRQRAGTDDVSAESGSRYGSPAEETRHRRLRVFFVSLMAIVPAASCVTQLFHLWPTPAPESETEVLLSPSWDVLVQFMLYTGPSLLAVSLLLLRGSPLDRPDESDDLIFATVIPTMCWALVALHVWLLFGGVAVMVVVWAGAMGAAGYLGYGLGVQERFNQLMAIKGSLPPMAPQNDFCVPVRRREEDVC